MLFFTKLQSFSTGAPKGGEDVPFARHQKIFISNMNVKSYNCTLRNNERHFSLKTQQEPSLMCLCSEYKQNEIKKNMHEIKKIEKPILVSLPCRHLVFIT